MKLDVLAGQIKAIRALLAEETQWWEKRKLRLSLIWLCLRRRNAECRAAVGNHLGDGLSNIQRIIFTERGEILDVLLLMAACCGTVGANVVSFLASSILKALLLASVFGCVIMSRIEKAEESVSEKYEKTIKLALLAWGMVNLSFTVTEIPARCGEEVPGVLYIVMGCVPVATVAFIMIAIGIVNICRRVQGNAPGESKMLEDAMHFLVRSVKFVWKLAQKKGKIRMMFILAACICGTVDVSLYVPFQFNEALFWATTSMKAFVLVLFLGWALKLADRGRIVPINLENTENVNWCYEVLEIVALTNLLTTFPVQDAVGFLAICCAVTWFMNVGDAVCEAWMPAHMKDEERPSGEYEDFNEAGEN